MTHWAPIDWATNHLKDMAKAEEPGLGEEASIVIWAIGSDGNHAQYVVNYQYKPWIYCRLPKFPEGE